MEKKLFPELGLDPEILQAIVDLGFDQPSPIQAQAIPIALEGRDIVGQSQTGSGKTMAFAVPVVQSIDPKERGVRALILCPTRELANQVCDEVHKLTIHKPGIKALAVYGGASYERQVRGLRDGAQIVVGTPGRVMDLVERGALKTQDLRLLVFDEADEMLDMGFRDEIENLVSKIPTERQTLFFSATFAGPIKDLIKRHTRDAVQLTIEHKALTVPTVEQRFYELNSRSKIEVLCRLLDMENPRLAVVFANTKRTVDDITDTLLSRGYSADRLHGDLTQMMRDRVMKNFRNGTIEILAATDVAARGLDVDDVDLVVNFEIPYDEEDYVHRIGRTGRAGRAGKAISLVSGREIFQIQRIQRYAKVTITRHTIPTREEVDGRRTDAYIEKLQKHLESPDFKSQDSILQRLLDNGHSSTDISSALLNLWISESSRGTQEILEDRPKAPKKDKRARTRAAQDFEGGEPSAPRNAFNKAADSFGEDEGPARHPREPRRQPRNFDEARPVEAGQTRMFLNVGDMDHVTAREITGAIYNTAGIPQGAVGRIEIYPRCSYVSVDAEHVNRLIDAMPQTTLRGRQLRMDIADNQSVPETGKRSNGGRGDFGRKPFGRGGSSFGGDRRGGGRFREDRPRHDGGGGYGGRGRRDEDYRSYRRGPF